MSHFGVNNDIPKIVNNQLEFVNNPKDGSSMKAINQFLKNCDQVIAKSHEKKLSDNELQGLYNYIKSQPKKPERFSKINKLMRKLGFGKKNDAELANQNLKLLDKINAKQRMWG